MATIDEFRATLEALRLDTLSAIAKMQTEHVAASEVDDLALALDLCKAAIRQLDGLRESQRSEDFAQHRFREAGRLGESALGLARETIKRVNERRETIERRYDDLLARVTPKGSA